MVFVRSALLRVTMGECMDWSGMFLWESKRGPVVKKYHMAACDAASVLCTVVVHSSTVPTVNCTLVSVVLKSQA